MAEYIEREALLAGFNETIYKLRVSAGENAILQAAICFVQNSRDFVASFPAADVVEVVRCKDCMWSETIKSIIDGNPMRVCNYGLYKQAAPDMHFCNHGHKKMDGKGEGE